MRRRLQAVHITYFVHGTSVDNEAGIASGWKDAPLSALGIEQSRALGEKLKDSRFDAVFSSDLKRAVDSATIAFGTRVPVMKKDARLRECNYGEYNGELAAIVKPLHERYIAEPFPGGESYEDVKKKVADFLEDVRKRYDGAHVAIVSHMIPQFALEVLLKGKTWAEARSEDWREHQKWQAGWEYVA